MGGRCHTKALCCARPITHAGGQYGSSVCAQARANGRARSVRRGRISHLDAVRCSMRSGRTDTGAALRRACDALTKPSLHRVICELVRERRVGSAQHHPRCEYRGIQGWIHGPHLCASCVTRGPVGDHRAQTRSSGHQTAQRWRCDHRVRQRPYGAPCASSRPLDYHSSDSDWILFGPALY